MHTDDPVLDLMDRFTAALNSHDVDAVAALVTEDIVSSPPRHHPTAPATKAGTRCAGSGQRCWRRRPRPGFPSRSSSRPAEDTLSCAGATTGRTGTCAAWILSGSEMASSPKAWPTSRASATPQQIGAPRSAAARASRPVHRNDGTGDRPALTEQPSGAAPMSPRQAGTDALNGGYAGGFYRASITLGAMSARCRAARRCCGCQRGRPGRSNQYALRHSCPWRQGARTCLIAVRGMARPGYIGSGSSDGQVGGDHGQPEPRQGRNRGIRCCGGSRWGAVCVRRLRARLDRGKWIRAHDGGQARGGERRPVHPVAGIRRAPCAWRRRCWRGNDVAPGSRQP